VRFPIMGKIDVKEAFMKKMIMGIAAVFAIFCLMGCPTEDDGSGSKQDGPRLPSGWTGLDLSIVTGTNLGEIEYGFTPTDPAAASYTVWYIIGSKNKAEEIEAVFGAIPIQHTTAVQNQPISNLLPGMVYSIVVVAVKGGEKGYSAVRSARARALPQSTSGFTMTVTGLPAATGGRIYGASLLDSDDQTPVAVAMGNNGKFDFYHSQEGTIPIDITRPFVIPGTYILVIALTNPLAPNNPEAVYYYTKDNGTVTYSDLNKNFTFVWSDFSDNAFVLTVSGTIPDVIVGAAVRENLLPTGTVLAVAIKAGGTFNFYVPDFTIPTMPIPTKTPWEGDGSYPLVLSTITGQQYLYTAGKELTDQTAIATTFDFTGKNGTANWSDFKQLP